MKISLTLFIVMLLIGTAFCQEPIPSVTPLELGLADAVRMSLSQNLTLQAGNLNRDSARADIMVLEGEFDPLLAADVSQSYAKTETLTPLVPGEERQTNYDISIAGKLRTGTQYTLDWTNQKINTNIEFIPPELNPYYQSQLILNLTQPLLKGFGFKIQEANINAAKKNFQFTDLTEKRRAEEVTLDTAAAYWGLDYRKQELEVAKLSLNFAEALQNEVQQKINLGALANVEIYQAEAEVFARREQVINAEKTLKDASDNLKRIMNYPDWSRDIITTEDPMSLGPEEAEEPFGDVLARRLDYKAALEQVSAREILQTFYKNQTLPQLDIVGSSGLNGSRTGFGDTYSDLSSTDFYSWQLGLTLSIPLGNRTARGNYSKAKYETEKARIAQKQLELDILYQLREARRALAAARQSLEAASSRRLSAQKRLEAEVERFRVGLAVLIDVFKFEVDFNQASSDENRARATYALAFMRLDQASGRILDRFTSR